MIDNPKSLLVSLLLAVITSSLALQDVFHKELVVVEDNGARVARFYSVNGKVRCDLIGDEQEISTIMATVESSKIFVADTTAMTIFLTACSDVELSQTKTREAVEPIGRALIFPGTKWCGAGNVAEHYDDLGKNQKADRCCRTHDHCPINIGAGKTKFGLTNPHIGTVSHCDCDDEFIVCLRDNKDFTSNTIGTVFFNVLGQRCIREDHPATCLKWGGIGNKQCLQYEFDTSKEKEWQFFDAVLYY